MNVEYLVTKRLPDDGERVLAFGHRTFCCTCDMEPEPQWYEVVFSFQVGSYELKKDLPSDLEETILEFCETREHWRFDDQKPFDHLIGVSKWRKIDPST